MNSWYKIAQGTGAGEDYLNIGSTPPEESCAQVGAPDYNQKALQECKRYIEVIRQKLGPEPVGARLAAKSFPHDFGHYFEVICYFREGNREALNYALACEGYGPKTWDDITPVPIEEIYAKINERRQEREEEDRGNDWSEEDRKLDEEWQQTLKEYRDKHSTLMQGIEPETPEEKSARQDKEWEKMQENARKKGLIKNKPNQDPLLSFNLKRHINAKKG